MADPTYGMTKTLTGVEYEKAVERTTEALKSEGFGVLTEIDVKATLKKKLDVDFPRYVILGACNPPLAHKALSAEEFIGLLLPCNVVVTEAEGGSKVSILRPTQMFQLVQREEMADLAQEVEQTLTRVLERI